MCDLYRDGYGCNGTGKCYLVINPEGTSYVICDGCIGHDKTVWEPGTLFFQIGDDVTNHFL